MEVMLLWKKDDMYGNNVIIEEVSLHGSNIFVTIYQNVAYDNDTLDIAEI